MAQQKQTYTQSGVGRRKSAVARVYLAPGNGEIHINGRALKEYFSREIHINEVLKPFAVTKLENRYLAKIKVMGGGSTGQAEAIRHGISRALQTLGPEVRALLKKEGLLTRDSRVVERKKYGQAGARRRFQYSKR